MIEFGSDFHYISDFQGRGNTLGDFYTHANYYADGRQALIHLCLSQGWQRLWVPEYFCYEVIESLKEAGLNLMFYTDWPTCHDDSETLEAIQRKGRFLPTDAILRVNYFGTRLNRTSEHLPVAAVVEDHTHDLIGDWPIHSTTDWCIASLRKSLPISEGGILWSPKGLQLPEQPIASEENERIAAIRWEAMRSKARYLAGEPIEKATFRAGYVDTEEYFDTAPVCALDKASQEYLKTFDIKAWYNKKRENWDLLSNIRKDGVQVVRPEGLGGYPFSLVLQFDNPDERDHVRKELITHQIYPAILWNIPTSVSGDVFSFSRCMLSIHCDARYTREEILEMKSIIESIV